MAEGFGDRGADDDYGADAEGLRTEIVQRLTDFNDPSQEWRRLFSEAFGTFFLVLVAAGGPMMAAGFDNAVGRAAAVTAPGMMVMAMILFMGKVSGAHFNPGVSVAFALRGDFPWKRVPGYLAAQILGAVIAAWVLQSIIGVSASYGSNYPAATSTPVAAFWMEAILTLGLISVILGTASGAQNVGVIGALAVGSYIALAGLWASPISGASMNTFRTLGPDIVANDYASLWVYVAGPFLGVFLAVLAALALRGYGGGRSGSLAAQGDLFTRIKRPGKS